MKQIAKKVYQNGYLFIAAVAIIIWLFAYFGVGPKIFQDTNLNLATELIGAVVVFLLVQYLFKIDELDTNQRIEKLLNKLEEKDKKVEAKNFFHPQPNMDEYIREAKKIDVCGVTLTVFINKSIGEFREAVKNGARIRILVIKKSPEVFKAATVRSVSSSIEYYEKRLESSLVDLENLIKYTQSLSNKEKGSFEVRLMNFTPLFGLEIFDTTNGNKALGKAKIEIYPHHISHLKPPIFTIHKDIDPEWYEYFQNQYEELWKRSEKFEP